MIGHVYWIRVLEVRKPKSSSSHMVSEALTWAWVSSAGSSLLCMAVNHIYKIQTTENSQSSYKGTLYTETGFRLIKMIVVHAVCVEVKGQLRVSFHKHFPFGLARSFTK